MPDPVYPPGSLVLSGPQPVLPGETPTRFSGDISPMDEATENIRQYRSRVFNQLPIDEAEQAVHAAMRFQGTRGYQRDLQNGVAPADAMAKWAPMLFPEPKQATMAGGAAIARAAQMSRAPVQFPGMGITYGGKFYPSSAIAGKDIQPKVFTDPTTGKQHLYNPQTGAAFHQPVDKEATVDVMLPDGTTVRGPLDDPAVQKAIQMKDRISTNLLSTATMPQAPRVKPASPFKEGSTVRSKKTGNLYRIVNGEPVPMDQETAAAP